LWRRTSTIMERLRCHAVLAQEVSQMLWILVIFLSKPSVDIQGPKLMSRSLSDCKKQPSMSTSQTVTRNTVRGQGITSEGKKKRSDENAETALKKHKNDSSTVSSSKMQVPKVKLGDKITALQQIVSPFGKTDTASVLGEAIGYIKFLQEQVQLLSNPYMKSNTSKDPWGSLERKDRGDSLFDLQSRGLCLVPISCTPHAYRENTGSDYWTPTYRGCLYRWIKFLPSAKSCPWKIWWLSANI